MEDVQLVRGMRMGLRCHTCKILQQWKLGHLVRHCDDDVVDRRERLECLSQELNRPCFMLSGAHEKEGERKGRETQMDTLKRRTVVVNVHTRNRPPRRWQTS